MKISFRTTDLYRILALVLILISARDAIQFNDVITSALLWIPASIFFLCSEAANHD